MERNKQTAKTLIGVAVGVFVLFALFSPTSAVAVADFQFEQGNPNSHEYLRVIFMGSLEGATASNDSQWVWNFGDGTTGVGKNVIHTYSEASIPTDLYEPIIFMVRLDVTPDGGGKPCSKSYKVAITEPSLAAQFALSAIQGPPPLEVTFTDTTFGRHAVDSLYFGYPGSDTTVNSLPATHVYEREGTYPVTFTVSRGEKQAKATKQVIVRKDAIYIGETSNTTEETDVTVTEVPDTTENSEVTETETPEITPTGQGGEGPAGEAAGDILFSTAGSFKLPDTGNISAVGTVKSKKDQYFAFFEDIIRFLKNILGIRGN